MANLPLDNLTALIDERVAEKVAAINANMDAFFVVTVGMIIFFMQCGFAFLEAGAVRTKNTTNILMKNIMDAFIGGFFYWAIGYALAFGGGNFFCGFDYFFSAFPNTLPDTEIHIWFFHFVFAATSSTIVSGAVAERCEMVAYFIYSALITGVIYPVVTHWAWSPIGWLSIGNGNGIAYQDFAGSGVVHLLGGTAAFVGSCFLGPRYGRFDENRKPVALSGHSVPHAALGFFILMFGFFAFNGGSQASISVAGDGIAISRAVMNTVMSSCVAGIFGLALKRGISCCSKGRNNYWSLVVTINCSLTGMVAICAGCNVFYPWAAAVVGVLSAMVYLLFSFLVVTMGVDDPLDAVAVHFGGGVIGVLSVPFFKMDDGIIYKGDLDSALSFAWNIGGASAIIGWTAITSIIIFGGLKCAGKLRVSEQMEIDGLDKIKHNEEAYPEWNIGATVPNGKLPDSTEMIPTNGTQPAPAYENVAFEDDINVVKTRL